MKRHYPRKKKQGFQNTQQATLPRLITIVQQSEVVGSSTQTTDKSYLPKR